MSKEYYVIVNLETLQYQKQGEETNLENADKFCTFEEAQKELRLYDEEVDLAIYKVKEWRSFEIKKMEELGYVGKIK